MDVDHLDPVSAVRTLAELTFDHHESHPDFVSLVAVENIHHGEFIAKSAAIAALNSPAVSVIAGILERGYASGAFRRRAEAIDIHFMISSFCFFRMSQPVQLRRDLRRRPARRRPPRAPTGRWPGTWWSAISPHRPTRPDR